MVCGINQRIIDSYLADYLHSLRQGVNVHQWGRIKGAYNLTKTSTNGRTATGILKHCHNDSSVLKKLISVPPNRQLPTTEVDYSCHYQQSSLAPQQVFVAKESQTVYSNEDTIP